MKVQIMKPVEIDIRTLLGRTTGTINRTVREFCKDTPADEAKMEKVLIRIREARMLIRNDADATVRMVKMRPEREDEYYELWSACANKLMDECCALLSSLFDGHSRVYDEDSKFKSGMIDAWATPEKKQKEEPTPLEAAAKGGDK